MKNAKCECGRDLPDSLVLRIIKEHSLKMTIGRESAQGTQARAFAAMIYAMTEVFEAMAKREGYECVVAIGEVSTTPTEFVIEFLVAPRQEG